MNPKIPHLAMSRIVGQNGLLCLRIATGLGEEV